MVVEYCTTQCSSHGCSWFVHHCKPGTVVVQDRGSSSYHTAALSIAVEPDVLAVSANTLCVAQVKEAVIPVIYIELAIAASMCLVMIQGNEVVYDPRTPTMGATPGKAGTGALTLNAAAGGASPNSRASPTSAGYMGGLAPAGTKVRRMSGAFTSGAVTHPASLAAAGKPTGLEGVVTPVGSPSSANAAHHHGHIV